MIWRPVLDEKDTFLKNLIRNFLLNVQWLNFCSRVWLHILPYLSFCACLFFQQKWEINAWTCLNSFNIFFSKISRWPLIWFLNEISDKKRQTQFHKVARCLELIPVIGTLIFDIFINLDRYEWTWREKLYLGEWQICLP